MKKILLILNPGGRYGVLAAMSRELQKALERAGIQAILFDCSLTTPEDLYGLLRSEAPDCT